MEIEVKLRIAERGQLLRQLARLKAKLVGGRVHEMNTLYDTAEGHLTRRGEMLRVRVERPAGRSNGAAKTRRVAARSSGGSALLTYKGPAPEGPGAAQRRAAKRRGTARQLRQYKIREEHELRISNPEEMPRILQALGLRPCFRYEKFRTTYRLPGLTGLKVEMDETPIGLFVELEGPRAKIDRAARLLGFAPAAYINTSYAALFMENRGARRGGSAGRGRGADRGARNEPAPSSGLPDMLFSRSK